MLLAPRRCLVRAVNRRPSLNPTVSVAHPGRLELALQSKAVQTLVDKPIKAAPALLVRDTAPMTNAPSILAGDSFTSTPPENVSQVSALIDREIDHARAERTRDGWTSWALLITIGALLWAAIAEWERRSFIVANAACWFVAASMFCDLVIDGFVRRVGMNGDPRRLRTGSFLGLRPPALVALAVRAGIIVAALIVGRSLIDGYAVLAVSAYYVLLSGILILITIVLARGYPLQAAYQHRPLAFTNLGSLLIGWMGLIGVVESLGPPAHGIPATSFRFGVLAAAALYLASMMASERHRDPLLESLVELRRSIALGEIDFLVARRQCIAILRGLALSDWLQHDIQNITNEYQRFLSFEHAINELATLCNSDLQQVTSGGQSNAATATIVRERLTALEALVVHAKAAYDAILRLSPEIAGKVGYATGVVGGEPADAPAIKRAVDPLVNDSISRWVRLEIEWRLYRDRVLAQLTALGL